MLKKKLAVLGWSEVLSRLRFAYESIKYYPANRGFLKQHAFPTLPLYNVFETYGANLAQYFHDGEATAADIAQNIKSHLAGKQVDVVCEWGMGMGRLIRNFSWHFPNARIIGYDYNAAYVECCQQNYPDIAFYQNQLLPPLPAAGLGNIDVLVAISIFTHLGDEAIRAWLQEFAQRMSPGGVFLFTAHGRGFYHRLPANEKQIFDAGQLVEWRQGKEGKRTFGSFHPKAYLLDAVPSAFEVVAHQAGDTNEQDVWILRRR
jgi:SAM-dependent methyltransferase